MYIPFSFYQKLVSVWQIVGYIRHWQQHQKTFISHQGCSHTGVHELLGNNVLETHQESVHQTGQTERDCCAIIWPNKPEGENISTSVT